MAAYKLVQLIARDFNAWYRLIHSDKVSDWEQICQDRIDKLVKEYMPSGSGIDMGTGFDWYASKPNKLVFNFSYHHMDEHGFYDGWTDHKCIVTPSLAWGFDIKITGRDRNQVKEHLHECFDSALHAEPAELQPY